jgi:preprotein translocase subunit SecF
LLGPGTLTDLSLSLFVGIAVGATSSLFLATPLDVLLREHEPRIKAHTQKVLAARALSGATGDLVGVAVPLKPGQHLGQGAQPKRKRP